MFLTADTFYDFDGCVALNITTSGYQYISPNLTFPCPGVVTKWKIGAEAAGALYLQIWRSDGLNYSRVDESFHFKSNDEPAEFSTNVTVSAGDVIGFFIPRIFGLEVDIAPVPDYTLLQGSRSGRFATPSGTFHESDVSSTVVGSSPLVTVEFGNTSA